jgi:hypothetical protein
MRKLLVVLLLMIGLSACAPDPRQEAAATVAVMQAQQAAADAEQARAQQAAEWQATMKMRLAVSESIAEWQIKSIPYLFGFALTVLLGVVIGVCLAAIDTGRAVGKAALLAARQIPLNPRTGQYPALVSPDGRHVAEINAGEVLCLDTPKDANPAMLPGSNKTRWIAVAGQSKFARKMEVVRDE